MAQFAIAQELSRHAHYDRGWQIEPCHRQPVLAPANRRGLSSPRALVASLRMLDPTFGPSAKSAVRSRSLRFLMIGSHRDIIGQRERVMLSLSLSLTLAAVAKRLISLSLQQQCH